jgi:hypothetical protein
VTVIGDEPSIISWRLSIGTSSPSGISNTSVKVNSWPWVTDCPASPSTSNSTALALPDVNNRIAAIATVAAIENAAPREVVTHLATDEM